MAHSFMTPDFDKDIEYVFTTLKDTNINIGMVSEKDDAILYPDARVDHTMQTLRGYIQS